MTLIASLCIALLMPALPPKKPIPPVPEYDWMAPPKRKGEPAPPPVPAAEIVQAFSQFIAENDDYDAKARSFVVEQQGKASADDLDEYIPMAYSVLSPEFKRALERMDADDSIGAADAFEALSKSDDPYLSVASANLAAAALIDLELIDRCEAILNDVAARHKPIEQYTTASGHFRFMLGYCQVHNLEYEFAYGTFEDFLKNHPNAPERLRTTAAQILTELSRRAPGRIGDVRDLLTYARRKIRTGYTDDNLLNRQEEAVALLESLIEEAEQQEQNKGDGEGEGRSGRRGRASGSNPGGGATESTLPSGGGKEGQLRKSVAKPGEMWGKMPPREREQVLQTLQKQFPSQYRELLEQYYKQLSKDAPAP